MSKKDVMICFRVTEEEKSRIELVVKRAQQRNALAVRTDVLKDAVGLTNLGLVNEEDRRFLQGSMSAEELDPLVTTAITETTARKKAKKRA